MTKLSDLIRAGRIDEATRLVAGGQMNESITPSGAMEQDEYETIKYMESQVREYVEKNDVIHEVDGNATGRTTLAISPRVKSPDVFVCHIWCQREFKNTLSRWATGSKSLGAISQTVYLFSVEVIGDKGDTLEAVISEALKAAGAYCKEVANTSNEAAKLAETLQRKAESADKRVQDVKRRLIAGARA